MILFGVRFVLSGSVLSFFLFKPEGDGVSDGLVETVVGTVTVELIKVSVLHKVVDVTWKEKRRSTSEKKEKKRKKIETKFVVDGDEIVEVLLNAHEKADIFVTL